MQHPLELLLRWRRARTRPEPRCVLGDSSGSEKISRSGLCFKDGVNACIVSPSGFGGAAEFSVRVQERSTQTALAKARVSSVAESFLHVGGVVMRREEVVEPFVGHPRSFRMWRVLQTPQPGSVRQPRSCAWSCGALRRLFRVGAKVSCESSPSSPSCEVEPLCSTLLPGLVRCLGCFL